MTSISGKYILLTGASRGIGPVIAEMLAERGAHLALAARSEEGLCDVMKSLSKYRVRMVALPADLAQPEQRRELVFATLEKFGKIDILINNAGIETEGAFVELPWEAIQKTIDVNLVAPISLVYEVLPKMLERKQGHIVNIASVSSGISSPYAAIYSATKSGLAQWARSLRLELEGNGVQFSTIFPGYITEVGMFARFQVSSPPQIGSSTPNQVARSVMRAIERNEKEIIINSSPARLLFIINEVSPSFADWITKKLGVVEFQRRKVSKGVALKL